MKKSMTADDLAKLAGVKKTSNLTSVFEGLVSIGKESGLHRPVCLVPYLAQLSHESAGFTYDREIWGPTPAQKRYDTRTDLGNTPEQDGDGKHFMGRTAMQITGGHNTRAFWAWCRERFSMVPDFVRHPELMNTDPWEGLGPIWYWSEGNPTGKSLNLLCVAGNFEMLTRRINGGLNGYDDRCDRYTQIALRALGYAPTAIRKYQLDRGLVADGIAGPATRNKLHQDLGLLDPVTFGDAGPGFGLAPPPAIGPKTLGEKFADLVKLLLKMVNK